MRTQLEGSIILYEGSDISKEREIPKEVSECEIAQFYWHRLMDLLEDDAIVSESGRRDWVYNHICICDQCERVEETSDE